MISVNRYEDVEGLFFVHDPAAVGDYATQTGLTGLVEADFDVYHNSGAPVSNTTYVITERGFGFYEIVADGGIYASLLQKHVFRITFDGEANTVGVVTYEVKIDILDTMDERHGHGIWGASYFKTQEDAIGTLQYGTWDACYPFDEHFENYVSTQFEGSFDFPGVTALIRENDPSHGEVGLLGRADLAIEPSTTDYVRADDGGTLMDVNATDEFAVAIVFHAGIPEVSKLTGGIGWRVHENAASSLRFEVDDGVDFAESIITGNGVFATYDDMVAAIESQGCIYIATASRTDGFVHSALILADGRICEGFGSTNSLASVGTTTNAENLTVKQSGTNPPRISQLMFCLPAVGSAVGIRANIIDILKRFHARLFPTLTKHQVNVVEWFGDAVPDTLGSGMPHVDVKKWDGTTVSVSVSGFPRVDTHYWRGEAVPATASTGVPKVEVDRWRGTTQPLTLSAQRVRSDIEMVSGDSTAADNLELQFDTTGLTGNTFPARQDALDAVDNFIDTEIGAIITAIGIIDDFLDTEIGAIISTQTSHTSTLLDINNLLDTEIGTIITSLDDISDDVADLQIDIDALTTSILRLLGLLHENSMVDTWTYDVYGNATGCRVRQFANAGAVPGAPNGSEGTEIARWVMSATFSALAVCTSYQMVKQL